MLAKGHATLSAGTTWKFRGREVGQIQAEQLSLNDSIQRARGTPALLYDYHDGRAFLVSELSIILHMICAYLKNSSRLSESRIPNAEPSSDGGQAAYRIIQRRENLMVPFGIGDSRKYSNIVSDFVKIYEQRKMQTYARQKGFEVSLSHGLRGWDYVDLQEKRYEFFKRQLPTHILSSCPVWWDISKQSRMMVVFGGNIGCPIRKVADNNQIFCDAWAEIPTGRHLLLANMTSLVRLKRNSCNKTGQNPGHYMITDDLAWARPIDSQLFEQYAEGGLCNPVQTMCKVHNFRHWDKRAFRRSPGAIADRVRYSLETIRGLLLLVHVAWFSLCLLRSSLFLFCV